MEVITCTYCNVDVSEAELKTNNLCCPTCGYDLSGSLGGDDDDDEDWDDEDEDDKDDDDEEDEDEK
jgi:hypothetical protein